MNGQTLVLAPQFKTTGINNDNIVYLGFSCRSTILILHSSIIKHLGHGYGTTREVGIVVQTLTNLGYKSTNVFMVTCKIVKGEHKNAKEYER
jgi:hypothetical protein